MATESILTMPGYYYLFALYVDYPINTAFFSRDEHAKRIREILKTVQAVNRLGEPFRKTWALRLFTERDLMTRFSPAMVNEAMRQLKQIIDLIGPPKFTPPPQGSLRRPRFPKISQENARPRPASPFRPSPLGVDERV